MSLSSTRTKPHLTARHQSDLALGQIIVEPSAIAANEATPPLRRVDSVVAQIISPDNALGLARPLRFPDLSRTAAGRPEPLHRLSNETGLCHDMHCPLRSREPTRTTAGKSVSHSDNRPSGWLPAATKSLRNGIDLPQNISSARVSIYIMGLNEGIMRQLFLACFAVVACSTLAVGQSPQATSFSDDVGNGHHLAALICSSCHVAGPDQLVEPILRPPAPSFEVDRSTQHHQLRYNTNVSRHDASEHQQPGRHAEPRTSGLSSEAGDGLSFELTQTVCCLPWSRASCGSGRTVPR